MNGRFIGIRAHDLCHGVLALLASASCLSAMGHASYRTVAITGDAAHDTGAEFVRFGSPVINAAGEVAFQAFLSGPTTDVVPHGVFAGPAGDVRTVKVAGQFAPVGGDARFRTPGPPQVLTENQETLFYGQLVNGGAVNSENDYGIWAGAPADVQTVARRGDAPPGFPAEVTYSLFYANPTSFGQIGFSASLQGPGIDDSNNVAAWVGPMMAPQQLQLIARTGDLAPGHTDQARFTSLGTPTVNAAGSIAMAAFARVEAPLSTNIAGIWGGGPDDLQLLAASDADVPGAPGRHFSFFGEPRINRRGDVAFTGYLAVETPEQQGAEVGMWIGSTATGDVQPIAIEGQAAPEFAASAVFQSSLPGVDPYYPVFSNPVLGGSGRAAFTATVVGDGIDFDHNDGVWFSDPVDDSAERVRTVVAREGDQPPGTPEGTRFVGQFTGDDLLSAFERPLLSTTGQIAFEASTTGPWGELARGIWATDSDGALRLVVHTGTDFEVAPGDVRTISLLKLLSGGSSDDGFQSAFNDFSQLAFGLSFTDGTEAIAIASVQSGDTNADGQVDIQDLNNVRNNFGGVGLGDTNGDRIVNVADLNNVRNNFGAGGRTAQPVPEPAAGVLMMIASATILGIARRTTR